MKVNRRTAIKATAAGVGSMALTPEFLAAREVTQPFGADFKNLETLTTGQWWTKGAGAKTELKGRRRSATAPPMDVPRDQVVAFAVYTHQAGTLKITAQLYPLKPGENRLARLELKRNGKWIEVAKSEVRYPGWYAHFRVGGWDNSKSVPYRVRHGDKAMFEGLIRRDPSGKNEIIVANLSCNSSNTTGGRPEIVANLKRQDPDLLFFSGDQTYRHTEHTAGWIEFGLQFRDIIRDRPAVCIPDDHDVGHGNVWGGEWQKLDPPGQRRWGIQVSGEVRQLGTAPAIMAPAGLSGSRAGESWYQRLFHANHRRRCGFRGTGGSQVQERPSGQGSANGATPRPHQRSKV